MYLEQTSHHPPISNFHYEGSAQFPYEVSGFCETQVNAKGVFKSMDVRFPGKVKLTLLGNGT